MNSQHNYISLKINVRSTANRLSAYLSRRVYSTYIKLARAINLPTVKSRYGPTFKANYSDVTFKFCMLAKYGFFYWDEIQSIDYPCVFLDVGANQGLYSIGAAMNPLVQHVYAFEPVSRTASFLADNIQLNNASEKVTVINSAVSDQSGNARIFVSDDHSGLATMSEDNVLNSSLSNSQEVNTVCSIELDRIIGKHDCAVIVKVDVEGHELKVVSEIMKTTFASRIAHIFYEVDEHWVDPSSLRNLLEPHDFVLEKVGSGSHYDVLAKRRAGPRINSKDSSFRTLNSYNVESS